MDKWTTVISPNKKWYKTGIGELFRYKDLISLFVKRDFITTYKQTILGPLWILLNPFVTTVLFTIVFGKIADISTDGVPDFLFYMCANIFWGLFSKVMTKTSHLYLSNASLVKKVYFPRLSLCVSSNISSLINFFIQLLMFLGFYTYYIIGKAPIHPNLVLLLVPVIILIALMLASGVGLILAALTTKYRDLSVMSSFFVQLWFYITPVVYPVSAVPERFYHLFMLNPMAPLVEGIRYAFFGSGTFSIKYIFISFIVSLAVLFLGLIIFSRSEKTFADTL